MKKTSAEKNNHLRPEIMFFALANELQHGCCAFRAKYLVHPCWLINTWRDQCDVDHIMPKNMLLP